MCNTAVAMIRTVPLFLVVGTMSCGSPTSTSPGAGGSSSGAASTGTDVPASSSSASGATSSGVEDSTGAPGTSSGSSTGSEPHCQVALVESFAVSPERFGSLTLAEGHPDVVVLGGWGWTLAGSADAPVVARHVDPAQEMLSGRFGPEGGWAFAEVSGSTVTVRPLDDPELSFGSTIPNNGQWVVGDIDDDGRDDLTVDAKGRFVLWRADGAGGFEEFAASQKGPAAQLYGHTPATQWAPPAVLVAEVSTGTSIVGFELEEDLLVKAYTTGAAALVWWAGGVVEPSAEASREILYVSYGGPLINPKQNEVGFLVGQDGAWMRRNFRFAGVSSTQPRATDLDGDGTLDALVGAIDGDRLVGACTQGEDELVPCLDVSLEGEPESIAVDADGQVWVATLDAGLWVYRVGPCRQ